MRPDRSLNVVCVYMGASTGEDDLVFIPLYAVFLLIVSVYLYNFLLYGRTRSKVHLGDEPSWTVSRLCVHVT